MMRWVEKITDRALWNQLGHMMREFNRTAQPVVFGETTLDLNATASGSAGGSVQFNAPQGGACVVLDLAGLWTAAGATSGGVIGLDVLVTTLATAETADNWNRVRYRLPAAGVSESFAYRRVFEVPEGAHTVSLVCYKSGAGTPTTLKAELNYALELNPRRAAVDQS